MVNKLLLVLIITIPFNSLAQKFDFIEGNLEALKGQTIISTEITFDNVIVGAGFPEKKFIADKKELWEIKEPGKGDEWEQMWYAGQQKYYNRAFRKGLPKYLRITPTDEAAYTIILKTTQIEPGWNGGVIGGVAWLNAQAWIVDSSDKTKVIAKIQLPVCKGHDSHGGDFEMSERILQAYETAGKLLGWFIRKNTPK